MGRVTLWMQMSLDGIADSPDEVHWPLVDEELYEPFVDELYTADALLLGRRTFELMASFWPSADVEPAISEFYIDFARFWKKTPKLVVSRTLDVVDWHTCVLGRNPFTEIAGLRAHGDSNIVAFGGVRTATTLMKYGLIDDYRIFVHPILLGTGSQLFPHRLYSDRLELIDQRSFPSGVTAVHYRQPRPATTSALPLPTPEQLRHFAANLG